MARGLLLLTLAAGIGASAAFNCSGRDAGTYCDSNYGYATCPSGALTDCAYGETCTTRNSTSTDCSVAAYYCMASRDVDPAKIGATVGWACGELAGTAGDCSAINPGGSAYEPASDNLHADWAFNKYFILKGGRQPSACKFDPGDGSGQRAQIEYCSTKCHTCNASAAATDAAVQQALSDLCGNTWGVNCTDINPGGAHYEPNTLRDHANWAFQQYYEAFRCVTGVKTDGTTHYGCEEIGGGKIAVLLDAPGECGTGSH